MRTIYEAQVTGIGSLVVDFLKEKMVVIFGDQSPKELHEIAVLHSGGALQENIQAGDVLIIDSEQYAITAIGVVANQTIRDMGHATLHFNGKDRPELPGTIYLEDRPLPTINVSSVIKIVRY